MPPSMKPPVVYMKKTKEKEFLDYQSFSDHKGMAQRFKKTLYYGKLPTTDRPSLPMTELAVELFAKSVPEGLGKIDLHFAADVSRNACMSPYSMILAFAYIDRLKRKSPDYLRQVSSSDLFLVSMMVASKFLYDEGEDEEVFNEEWAKSANIDTKEINYLERKFLAAIDWNVFLGTDGFMEILQEMELKIARRKSKEHGSCTYTDLTVMMDNLKLLKCWHMLMDSFIKAIAVSVVAYSACILTMLGSVVVSHQIQLQAVQTIRNFHSSSLESPSSQPHQLGPRNDSDSFFHCDTLKRDCAAHLREQLMANNILSAYDNSKTCNPLLPRTLQRLHPAGPNRVIKSDYSTCEQPEINRHSCRNCKMRVATQRPSENRPPLLSAESGSNNKPLSIVESLPYPVNLCSTTLEQPAIAHACNFDGALGLNYHNFSAFEPLSSTTNSNPAKSSSYLIFDNDPNELNDTSMVRHQGRLLLQQRSKTVCVGPGLSTFR